MEELYELTPEANAHPVPVEVKCTDCKTVTPHLDYRILPMNSITGEPSIAKAKRLSLCQKCGRTSLTK